MNVGGILKSKGGGEVATVASSDPVSVAAAALAERKIGAVVVADGTKVEGILSERDIVRALAAEATACLDKPVSAYMTADVVTADLQATVDDLMALMTKGRFRHVPVVVDGALHGIVSIGDVVRWKIEEAEQEAERLREYIATG